MCSSQSPNRTKIVITLLVVMFVYLGSLPAHAHLDSSNPDQLNLQNRVFLPLVSQQNETPSENEQLVAIYSISIDPNGKPSVQVAYPDNVTSANSSIERPPLPEVVIIPDAADDNVAASSITCPFGGTGAQYLGSYWFYNPYPDLDFGIDYKVPKNFKEYKICITPALAAALTATGRSLLTFRYTYDSSNYRDLVVIGSSIVRKACQTLTGNPSCGDSLLRQQAEVRYRL